MCSMKVLSILVKKVMAKVKVFFQKEVKFQGQGHKAKNYGTV